MTHHRLAEIIASSQRVAVRLRDRAARARLDGRLVEPVATDELQEIALIIGQLGSIALEVHDRACAEASR